jgi:hypothetical protein
LAPWDTPCGSRRSGCRRDRRRGRACHHRCGSRDGRDRRWPAASPCGARAARPCRSAAPWDSPGARVDRSDRRRTHGVAAAGPLPARDEPAGGVDHGASLADAGARQACDEPHTRTCGARRASHSAADRAGAARRLDAARRASRWTRFHGAVGAAARLQAPPAPHPAASCAASTGSLPWSSRRAAARLALNVATAQSARRSPAHVGSLTAMRGAGRIRQQCIERQEGK